MMEHNTTKVETMTDINHDNRDINVQKDESKLEMQDGSKKVTYDDILQKIGQFGPYQRRIYFLLFLPTIFCAMHKLGWTFIGAKVDHRCRLPTENLNATYDDFDISGNMFRNKTCHYYLENDR